MRIPLIALVLVAAAAPVAAADDELATACHVVSNAHNVFGPLGPVSGTAGPICWSVRSITGPVGTELVPEPGAGLHPAASCAQADGILDRTFSSTWYEFCVRLGRGDAEARIYPTQATLSCTSSSCTYLPTYHVSVDGTPAGDWVIRGGAHLRSVSGGGVGGIVSGSQRALECSAGGALGACHAQVDGPTVSAGNFNTYLWQGWWSLSWKDPAGGEHLMATGAHECYVAQYYSTNLCQG